MEGSADLSGIWLTRKDPPLQRWRDPDHIKNPQMPTIHPFIVYIAHDHRALFARSKEVAFDVAVLLVISVGDWLFLRRRNE